MFIIYSVLGCERYTPFLSRIKASPFVFIFTLFKILCNVDSSTALPIRPLHFPALSKTGATM